MRPCGKTTWVRQTVAALEWVRKCGLTVISSIGVAGWDLITTAASEMSIPLQLYLIPGADDWDGFCAQVAHDFRLNTERTQYIPVHPVRTGGDHRTLMQLRDLLVVEAADLLVPIAISDKGSMKNRLEKARAKEIAVDERFLCEASVSPAPIGYVVDPTQLTNEARKMTRDYYVHWTRANNGPWPDEHSADYWHAVVRSQSYPRSGYETLRHIVTTGRIIASSRHMRNGIATVGFSDLPPDKAAGLMRYRSRYREMSFEPYGVGIRKTAGKQLGLEPVCYMTNDENVNDPVDLWRYQSQGQKSDWRRESEYRARGDVNLNRLEKDDLVLFTRFRSEANALAGNTGLCTIPFFENPV